jgi:arsenate reductase
MAYNDDLSRSPFHHPPLPITDMAQITVHGIPNCDTVKKARAWFASNRIDTAWHDFKKQGVPEAALDTWLEAVGWERLLNRQGTTWRKLDDAAKAAVVDAASAKALMLAQSSVIKRPVVQWADGSVSVGFDEPVFSKRAGG